MKPLRLLQQAGFLVLGVFLPSGKRRQLTVELTKEIMSRMVFEDLEPIS
ncbi:hypothetical protein SAMN05444422_111106 [Halobiforma haloterrestris]|uniref:Uncharacterized protein n=1 Tax=Natronobacterium haloterrestre TaxID=148448 RepID=A0A1I1KQG4_NATHA|nr:hypothetical protein SAMN05444422_111106 [Halobiforma haloterrestris]